MRPSRNPAEKSVEVRQAPRLRRPGREHVELARASRRRGHEGDRAVSRDARPRCRRRTSARVGIADWMEISERQPAARLPTDRPSKSQCLRSIAAAEQQPARIGKPERRRRRSDRTWRAIATSWPPPMTRTVFSALKSPSSGYQYAKCDPSGEYDGLSSSSERAVSLCIAASQRRPATASNIRRRR